MHAVGPRAVGPHGKPVEASASTTASDVGDIWKSVSKNLKVVLATFHRRHGRAAATVAAAVRVRGRVWAHVTLTTMEASPAVMRKLPTDLSDPRWCWSNDSATAPLPGGRDQRFLHTCAYPHLRLIPADAWTTN